MKVRKLLAVIGAALLFLFSVPTASAAGMTLTIDGVTQGPAAMTTLWHGTTYVSLRAVSNALDSRAAVSWENDKAYVRSGGMELTARAGDSYITVNGEKLSVPDGVLGRDGRILVPIRVLAQAFNASVYWNPADNTANVTTRTADLKRAADESLDDQLFWMSRIISAESRGERLEGQIAVGNVVLNRVASPEFPDTIYGVIFDDRWGGQFEPVRNGTVYDEPTPSSVLAAQLCLEGVNVVGDSLYFLAPALARNFWTVQNRQYVATLGCHDFYR